MRVWFILLSVWLLSSCASHTPKVHYYLLTEPSYTAQPVSAAAPVAIGVVSLADYLGGTGLVVEQAGAEIVLTRQHRWAEALDRQLQRQLRQGLGQLYPGAAWRLHSQQVGTYYRLDVLVDAFQITADNTARVDIQWYIQHRGQGVIHTARLEHRLPLTGEGYGAAVAALSEAWHHVLQQMAADVQAHVLKQERVAGHD
ncbi:hypothetical protein CWE15_11195 [Aliidiomarina taiwanensis]|uniref:ABC-type transport auxiliary lipoprotein component domain-containing protein n=1 Tax=Aliidiomarina taiwanensis TaxID=946228 RepID=A0A432WVQ2_9GAMM|nr:ABC-type transport auxiliary lipoprotein family protein [Aliidiomarina taiwanensis]RUO37844.1 hypothetical protein CWE15_11195 [Aliidiomarina taiwanensis]